MCYNPLLILFAEIFPIYGNSYLSSASNRQAETEGSTKMKVCHSITFDCYHDLTRGFFFSVRPLDFQESMRFDTVPSVSKAPTLE